MRPLTLVSLGLLLVSAALSAQTFRTGTKIVPLYVTVTDAQKRLVPDLVQQDFEILEDGKPREIELFETEVLPISVVVMLDTSGSMTLVLDQVKSAAEQFLIRLYPEDRGTVGAFNDKIQLSGPLTHDRDELVAALRELGFGNPTRLYDAIDASLDHLDGVEGRRVVLVFTDGADTFSRTSSGKVLDRARAEGVMVYGIGLETRIGPRGRYVSKPDRVLRRLAEETGGGYFELKKTDELGSTFTRVAQELHSQYVLGFAPERLDGKVHKLEVRVKQPGMNARSRRSYVATPEGTATP
jgi:Ca-activated chloride channel homolog